MMYKSRKNAVGLHTERRKANYERQKEHIKEQENLDDVSYIFPRYEEKDILKAIDKIQAAFTEERLSIDKEWAQIESDRQALRSDIETDLKTLTETLELFYVLRRANMYAKQFMEVHAQCNKAAVLLQKLLDELNYAQDGAIGCIKQRFRDVHISMDNLRIADVLQSHTGLREKNYEKEATLTEIDMKQVRRYWQDPEEMLSNQKSVKDYTRKCEGIRQRLKDTVDAVCKFCYHSIMEESAVYERFHSVRESQDFELYNQETWRKKLAQEYRGIRPDNIHGYQNSIKHSICLRDGETILESATHECIHALAFCKCFTEHDAKGNIRNILRNGIRCDNLDTGSRFAYGLNEGITEMYTRLTLKQLYDGEKSVARSGHYDMETYWASQLRNLAGSEAVDQAYFCGNTKNLEAFVDKHAGVTNGWMTFCQRIDVYEEAGMYGDIEARRQNEQEINNMLMNMKQSIMQESDER